MTRSRKFLELTRHRRRVEARREQTEVARELLRYTFPQELISLLHHNGFAVIDQYGDWHREPLSATSTSIIAVCPKPASS